MSTPGDEGGPQRYSGTGPAPGWQPAGYWEQQAGASPPAYPAQAYVPDHPRATLSLVLGILGLIGCSVAAPFAWVIGRRAVEEIDASGGRLGGRGTAQAGYVLGVVGTVILGLGLAFVLVMVVIAGVALVSLGNVR